MVIFAGGEPQFVHYTEKNGLSNNFIYGATEDAQGFIWMSTNLGLSRLDPKTGKVKNYDAGDGLPSNEFNEGAFHRSADGELFFGGNSGVVSFRPVSMGRNQHLPGVAVSSFKIFERPLNVDSLTAAAGEIRLRYWENFFSFEFVALDYTNPRKNQYAYQLEGVNADWVYSGNRHYANFTNVPPGMYTFRVKGSNSDGVWNENAIAAIRLTIQPPFWKTWWFYISVAVLLAGVASLLHEYRVKANVTRLMELERVKLAENERVRKLAAEDLHDEFGNRLTRISLLTDLIKARLNGHGAEVEDLLNKIRDNSSQLYQGTKDFIWSLNPQNDSVFEVAIRLKDFGDDIFDKTPVVFLTEGITDELRTAMLPMGQSRHLILLFKEAMSNVLKHSEAERVSLHFHLNAGQLKICLTDNGLGFGTEREGAGNGLMNMQSRSRKLSGNLSVSSQAGGGTVVSLTLPVKYLTPAAPANLLN
jgi:signal transduction histidine kinase